MTIKPRNQIVVVPAQVGDLREISALHMETNPDSYLTSLGPVVLRAMYRQFITRPQGLAFVAKDTLTQRLAGAAIGCENPPSFYRKLAIRSAPAYLRAWTRNLLFGTSDVPGPMRRLRGQNSLFQDSDIIYFTQLNVSGRFRRKGIGTRLASAFYDETRARGFKRVYLVTERGNTSVRRLHEAMGCELVKEYTTAAGNQRCLYRRDFE